MASCMSALTLTHELDVVRPSLCLAENEDSWDTIAQGMARLTSLCNAGGCDLPTELISFLRSVSRPIIGAMTSERTRLSGVAIELISVVASGLGRTFEPLLSLFFPTLLMLCSRTNKIILNRARTVILTIIETTQLPSILPQLLICLKDKSASLRLTVAEATLTCMNCFNPPDLEKDARAKEIETIIRAVATDANADVRKVGIRVFEAYKIVLPGRVDSFTAPLTPTIRKYLNITAKGVRSRPQDAFISPPIAVTQSKSYLSSSTSALRTITAKSDVKPSTSQRQTHGRSASSSAVLVSKSGVEAGTDIKSTHDPTQRSEHTHMPPPDYVPVRPTHPISATRPTQDHHMASVTAAATRPLASSSRTTSVSNCAGPIPPPSSYSDGPQRRMPPSTVKSAAVVGGAQRVPLPIALPKVELLVTRPTPSFRLHSDRPTRPVPSTAAEHPKKTIDPGEVRDMGRGKNTGLKTKETAPVIPALNRAAVSGKPRSLTQPTLSQLSRTRPPIERKAARPVAAKPMWGRLAAHSGNPALKGNNNTHKIVGPSSSSNKRAVQFPAGQSLDTSATDPVQQRTTAATERPAEKTDLVITAAEIPLPPSPPPSSDDATDIIEVATPVSHNSQDSEVVPDKPSSFTCGDSVAYPCLSSHSAEDSVRVTITGSSPSSPHTPGGPMRIESVNDKTPISALLSSIERGFLFTPSSPLSPPQSYLRDGVALGGSEDLFLLLDRSKAEVQPEQQNAGSLDNVLEEKTRMEMRNRSALGNVGVNK